MADKGRLSRDRSQAKRGIGGAAVAVRPNLKTPRWIIRWPRTGIEWLGAVLRALPIATALGFGLGLVLLNEIFGGWGLSAFQLVGPGDVLVPSLMIGIGASALVTLPVGAALLLSMCMLRLDQDRKHGVTGGAILVSILAWPMFLIPNAGTHLWRDALPTVSVIAILIGSGAAVWTLVEYFRSPPRSFLRRVMVVVAILWLVMWVGAIWREGFDLIVRKGPGHAITAITLNRRELT